MALFHYHNTATVRNQHQLLTYKTSKWHSLLFLKTVTLFSNYHPKLNEMQYLKTPAFKNWENFPTKI